MENRTYHLTFLFCVASIIGTFMDVDGRSRRVHKKADSLSCPPRIGDKAPAFKGRSTEGEVSFPEEFEDNWIIFFSHPADFTPVCTTEFKRLAAMVPEFEKLHTKLVGISVDKEYTHKVWMRNLEKQMEKEIKKKLPVKFPVIADPKKRISNLYGMIHPHESKEQTIRSVYFIDPKGIIRAIFYYPIANGRSFNEIKRLLIAMQTSDEKGVATGADWEPGKPTISLKSVAKDILVN
jgi:peroxiredoxin 2/4